MERLAEDKDVDLLALAKNPQGLDVAELVAKLLARDEELEKQANRIAAQRKECRRHIGTLASLTYTKAASEDVTRAPLGLFEKARRYGLSTGLDASQRSLNFGTQMRPPSCFPNGLRGAAKPPYRDGVVEASFEGRDALGREYPKELVAGTSVERR